MTLRKWETAPRILRGAFCVSALAVAIAGCVPSRVKEALPVLSTREASYAGYWYYWFPRWHRLYSLLPGSRPAQCDGAPTRTWTTAPRLLSIRNCTVAGDEGLARLAVRLGDALNRIEASLGSMRVATASYTLVPPDRMLILSRSQWLRPRSLAFDIAIRFEKEEARASEVEAVRATAHELYHLWNRALGRAVAEDQSGRTEEMRAALFESCIEMDVFGAVGSRALDPLRQSEPGVVGPDTDLHSSMKGNLRATRELASIAGSDQRLSPQEAGELDALCESISG